jgi:hypothetical protein
VVAAPGGRTAYASAYGLAPGVRGYVFPINTATNKPGKLVKADTAGKAIPRVGSAASRVDAIDTATGTVNKAINTGENPESIAIAP